MVNPQLTSQFYEAMLGLAQISKMILELPIRYVEPPAIKFLQSSNPQFIFTHQAQ